MPELGTSTGAPTETLGLVSPTVTTAQGTLPTAPAGPAQTTTTFTSPSPSQQIVDTSALIAQYENRIRGLMSEKDKAINERNQAISQLTDLQRTYESLQTQTQSSLTGAANAAQQAIDRASTMEQQMNVLQGEALRAQTLLERPHLAPYAQFIPAINDAEKVKAAIEQLETIRQQDIARQQQAIGQPPYGVNTNAPGMPPPLGAPATNWAQNVYQGRTVAPQLTGIPGSTPAQMNPAGGTDPTVAIQQLFNDAKRSGSPEDFERAIQQAALLSQTAINQQFGRSS